MIVVKSGKWIYVLVVMSIFHLMNLFVVESYNMDISSAIIKRGPKGSFFGFSLVRHDVLDVSMNSKTTIILVGAPLANALNASSHSRNIISSGPGAIYACSLKDKYMQDKCSQISLFNKSFDSDQKYYGLGVVVASQGTLKGSVVACTNKYKSVGTCILLTNDLKFHDFFEPYKEKIFTRVSHENETYQSITSAYIDENGHILIGDPGYGAIYGYNVIDGNKTMKYFDQSFLEKSSQSSKHRIISNSNLGMSVAISNSMMKNGVTYIAGAPRSKYFGEVFLMQKGNGDVFDVKLKLKGHQISSNFGYKVKVIDLDADGYDDLIVSAPLLSEASTCGGAVYIFMNANLAAGLNVPSLVIKNTFCKEPGILSDLTDCHNSWFGADVEPLGDVDLDGFIDIVIGAPYEGSGAIYIFRGSKDGLSSYPPQRIHAKSFSKTPLQSFGYSLSSSNVDFDSNGFPDLAVGCYMSDAVIIMRSRPIIDVFATFTSEPALIDPRNKECHDQSAEDGCFLLSVCMFYFVRGYNSSKDSSELELEINLEVENFNDWKASRAYFKYMKSKPSGRRSKNLETWNKKLTSASSHDNQTLNKSISRYSRIDSSVVILQHSRRRLRLQNVGRQSREPKCFSIDVYVKDQNTDFLAGIKFRLTYKMISFSKLTHSYRPMISSNFVFLNPVLSQDSVALQKQGVMHEVNFVKNCSKKYKCESNLKVWGFMEMPKDIHGTYILKSSLQLRDVKLFVQASNLLEDAYESLLFIFLPSFLSFKGADMHHFCNPKNDIVVCHLGNPLKQADEVSLLIRLDASLVGPSSESFSVKLLVNTTSTEVDSDDNLDVVNVRLQFEADLIIMGSSSPSSVYYNDNFVPSSNSFFKMGSEVVHNYEIKYIGHSPALNVAIEMEWPIEVQHHKTRGGNSSLGMQDFLLLLTNVTVEGPGMCESGKKIFNSSDSSNEAHMMLLSYIKKFKENDNVNDYKDDDELTTQSWSDPFHSYLTSDFRMFLYDGSPKDRTSNIVALSCEQESFRCTKLKCFINQLTVNSSFVVQLHFWFLFSNRLVHQEVDGYEVRSSLHATIIGEKIDTYIINRRNDASQVVTVVSMDISTKKAKIPIWTLLVSSCSGVFFFIIIASALNKMGFFKRKRYKRNS